MENESHLTLEATEKANVSIPTTDASSSAETLSPLQPMSPSQAEGKDSMDPVRDAEKAPFALHPSPLSLPITIQRSVDIQVSLTHDEDHDDDIARFSSLDGRVRKSGETFASEDNQEHDTNKVDAPKSASNSLLVVKTELVLQRFCDRTFLLVSQRKGRIGTYLICRMEHSIIDNSTTFAVQVLLGKRDDTVIEVLARQIHERIFIFESQGAAGGVTSIPPLMLGITLDREHGYKRDCFQQVIDTALQMYRESCGE